MPAGPMALLRADYSGRSLFPSAWPAKESDGDYISPRSTSQGPLNASPGGSSRELTAPGRGLLLKQKPSSAGLGHVDSRRLARLLTEITPHVAVVKPLTAGRILLISSGNTLVSGRLTDRTQPIISDDSLARALVSVTRTREAAPRVTGTANPPAQAARLTMIHGELT
ncbi:hypothetical protein Bbelb_204820 [Branchiostoma belcheri]|nr:hypothetical protein Bbelb_204820 [Branchiostoma belcheri]